MSRRAILIFHFLLLLLSPARAQVIPHARISGVVTDAANGEPLQDVHVFISKSMIGAVTASGGTYLLTLPLGAHRIVVSMIGFITQTHDVMVRAPRKYALDFQLDEEIIEAGAITVSAERDSHWDDLLKRFEEQFIGQTPFSKDVEILNSEILDFTEEDGRFTATTAEPIMLINHALGYKIEHHLHSFIQGGDETWQDGESYFQEMEPQSEEERLKWVKNRERAFDGSAHHFFISLIDHRAREEGFITYAVQSPQPVGESDPFAENGAAPFRKPRFAVNPSIYLSPGKSGREFIFDFRNYLQVVYTREPEDSAYGRWQRIYHSGEAKPQQHSWIRLQNGPVTVDDRGNVINPYGVAYFGYMAFERLADLLPKEYRPAQF